MVNRSVNEDHIEINALLFLCVIWPQWAMLWVAAGPCTRSNAAQVDGGLLTGSNHEVHLFS